VTGAGTGLVVRDVAVRAVVVPLRRPLAAKVGDFTRRPLLLIDVATERGIICRGYLAPYLSRATPALRSVIGDLGAALRGWPVAPAAAFEDARGWLEWQDWAHPVLAHPFEVRSGELHLPDVPGNGLEWDERAVAHYQVEL
jgi:hypothetical protein